MGDSGADRFYANGEANVQRPVIDPSSAGHPHSMLSYSRRTSSLVGVSTGSRAVWLSLGAVAAIHIGMFAYYFLTRVRFPLAIDWIEGGGMVQADRLANGQTIYPTDPSTFVPYAYPPVYYAAVAAVSRLVGGVSFAVGRSVSAGAFMAAAIVAGIHAQRRVAGCSGGARVALGLGVTGLTVSAIHTVRGGFDIARVDSLAGALMLFALVLAEGASRPDATHPARRAMVAAAVMALAVYTKQTHLLVAAGVTIPLVRANVRTGIVYAGTLAGLVGAGFVALQWLTHGGFAMWVFGMRHHDFLPDRLLLGIEILAVSAPHVFLSVAVGLVGWKRMSPSTRFWLQATLLAIPMALIGFAKIWGEANNFISLMAIVGIPTLLVAADVAAGLFGAARRPAVLAAALAVLLVGRLVEHDPFRPPLRVQASARRLVDEVARLDGDVVSPTSPFMAHVAGHSTPQVSLLAVLDGQASRVPGVSREAYMAALRRQRPRYLLLTGHPVERTIAPLTDSDYHFVRAIEAPSPYDVVLMTTVPNLLYERNGAQ